MVLLTTNGEKAPQELSIVAAAANSKARPEMSMASSQKQDFFSYFALFEIATSRLLTSSLSLGVPVPRATQCMRGV